MGVLMVEKNFFRISGVLWIDWVDTQAVSDGAVTELVGDFAEFVAWLQAFGVISPQERSEIESWSKKQQANVLQAARELRAVLRSLCEVIAADKVVPQEAIDVLNTLLARRALQMQLRRTKSGVEVIETLQLSEGLGIYFQSRVRRLIGFHPPIGHCLRVREPGLYSVVSTTQAEPSRRWCSMEGCGNRHKVTAHYRKRKQQVEQLRQLVLFQLFTKNSFVWSTALSGKST
jgi:predicted RNA-binding Zn ribbon-like protein